MTDHREQNSTCPVTWEEEPRGFLTEWEATPMKPTEDAKMKNDEAERPAYLIRKNGFWYRPNCRGYTTSAIQAGRYTMAEAEKFTHPNGPDGPRDGMHYVHEDEVNCDDLKAYRTQAARIAELEGEREALSLAICGGEDAPGYAASLNVAVLEEVARSNRLSHIQALETVSRNLRHWREECGKLYSRIATLEAEKREAVMQQLASDGQACEAYAAQRVAEAEVARLREALTLIERLYYIEDKDAGWRASRMNGVAREAQDGNDLGHYRRIFPRAALQPKQED